MSSCRLRMLKVIKAKNIQIEKGEEETEKPSLGNARKAASSEDIASSSSNGVSVIRRIMSDPAIEVVVASERESQKKMWDFEVKWLTEAEENEFVDIPSWGLDFLIPPEIRVEWVNIESNTLCNIS